MSSHEWQKRRTLIETLLQLSRPIFDERRLAKDLDIHADEKSGPNDLVTKYDREVEALIRSELEKNFPGEYLLGEESAESAKPQAPAGCTAMWVLDPIDGTTNFYKGYPFFCSTLSFMVLSEGRWTPVVACTWDPTRDEVFSAARGFGATLNGERIAVSSNGRYERGLFASGFASTRGNPDETQSYQRFIDITRQTLGVRRDAAAALDLAYVACGRIDGYWEWNLSPWDLSAGALLVEEAGGHVSDLDGNAPWNPFCGEIIATNRKLHKSLLNGLGSIAR
ncbi:MAG TPA: inositol monophosphatase family protein [Bdellovibrionota bacterium]|jgi:myo-inositol-1(or 4)-monophosphatase|nr:inositol monophosphatase family protein [Bdellovibrionota bacterium]